MRPDFLNDAGVEVFSLHLMQSDNATQPTVLCLGAGFTTSYLARHFDADVRFLSRDLDNDFDKDLKAFKEDEGFIPQIIVDSIPLVHDAGRLLNPLYREAWAAFKSAVFIHLSSTSVYDRNTPLVNEQTAPVPEDSRGQGRLDLEEAILREVPEAVIMRCGGIYGPGRCLPLSIKKGQAAHIPTENRYVSRIHVYDLCRLILALGLELHDVQTEQGLPSVYSGFARKNLLLAVDPHPSATADTLSFIHEQWKLTVPDIAGEPIGRRIESLYTEKLGPFAYVDFRAGFMQCMLNESV